MSVLFFPHHLAMHVPDGFLSLPVTLVTWIFAIAIVGISPHS